MLQAAFLSLAVVESVLQLEIPRDSYLRGSSKESTSGLYIQYIMNCGENLHMRVYWDTFVIGSVAYLYTDLFVHGLYCSVQRV